MTKQFSKLLKYSLLKVSLIPLTLLIIASLVFVLLRVAPGDPVDAILGSGANEIARDILRNKLGLNDSLLNQYLIYIKSILQLNFGESLSTRFV